MKRQHLKLFTMTGIVLSLFSCQQASLEEIAPEADKGKGEEILRVLPTQVPGHQEFSETSNSTRTKVSFLKIYRWEADTSDSQASTYFEAENIFDFDEVTERDIDTQTVLYNYNTWYQDANFLYIDDPSRSYNVALPLHGPGSLASAYQWDWDTSSWVFLRQLRLDIEIPTTPSLTVSPGSLSFPRYGTNFQVTVTSNTSWSASTNDYWMTITSGSGTNDGNFTVYGNSNCGGPFGSGDFRSGNITISYGQGEVLTIPATQSGCFTIEPY